MQPPNTISSFSIFSHIHNRTLTWERFTLLIVVALRKQEITLKHHKTALISILYALKHLCGLLMFAHYHKRRHTVITHSWSAPVCTGVMPLPQQEALLSLQQMCCGNNEYVCLVTWGVFTWQEARLLATLCTVDYKMHGGHGAHMLLSQWRDAAQVGLIRLKITHGQLIPSTIKFLCIQCFNVHRKALMCLFCLVHD